ncbi:MAG TPA: amidophosphoribosyltransferase [Terriglobales bacterium]|nr:amidophosphoribosyltransferase [Terriglobales bacterium]
MSQAQGILVPWDKLREECGIVGVWGHPEAANLAYLGLYALQHRGQESAGIASSDVHGNGQMIHAKRSMGLVADIFTPKALGKLPGRVAIGHTRYSTSGDSGINNAQPLIVECNKGRLAIAHNGNLTNAAGIRTRLEAQGSIFQTTSDTEVILHLIAQSRATDFDAALEEALHQVEGAYSLMLLTPDSLYAIRDPWGFRPLAWGRLATGGAFFASETCAFDLIGAKFERDVEPGEWVRLRGDSQQPTVERHRFAPARQRRQCVFEHVYFARPDSLVFERSVQQSREEMGRILAREAPADADIVVPVPDSGVAAALGYSAESGLPCRFGLIRSHYVGRTFIEPSQQIRDFGVKLKLNPVRRLLEGKRVVLVDDSIVRGTTSRKIVNMIREAGAQEVHLRISCPPTISPCYYGVDTPSKDELIAANQTLDQIRASIGADTLAYLSLDGLAQAVENRDDRFCTACYTGRYPTPI